MNEDPSASASAQAGRATVKSKDAECARLVVLAGDQLGRRFVVQNKETIGRSDEATIVFDDGELSRNHARIRQESQGKYVIEDLDSSNGTLLNGVPVTRAPLAYGDKIQLGANIILMFSRYDLVEEQLLQRRRVELFGRLGAGVAHDLNNMLTVIASSVHGIRACAQEGDPEMAEWLDDLESATVRANTISPRLLRCVQSRSRGERQDIDLSSLCNEVCELVRHALDCSINIERDIHPLLSVTGQVDELHQGFMNLCLNARDAMPHGGTLRVTAALASGRRVAALPLSSKGPFIEISVSDTGAGMDNEQKALVFEPFFTTKRDRGGLGLGLATLKETVNNHGGCVSLETEPGQGCTFRVCLPAARPFGQPVATIATVEGLPARRPVPAGTTVLVVDAEPIVRRSWCRLLNRSGYLATEADSAEVALDLCSSAPTAPALAVVDLDLTVSGDQALHQRLRELHPAMRLLLTSPNADPRRLAEVMAEGALGLLTKPVSPQTLLAEVEQLLSLADPPSSR
jgi:two-component system cell cycle sensor histidine kinase/response regulator CckA